MKDIKIIILFCLSVLCISSCSDFEQINTNPQGVTPKMLERDGIAVGGFIQTLQKCVVPIGTIENKTDIINAYQTAYHLGQDTWSGYFAQNQAWNGGNNHTTYFLMNDWIKSTFQQSYTEAYSPWLALKGLNNPVAYALAQVLKIATWHKATDCFGPIPYTKAGDGLFVTPYDSQEDVYKAMFTDLEEAIKVLTSHDLNGGKTFTKFDLVYSGDTKKWVKFANSLMLRMAIRVRYADKALSMKYAQMAVGHPIGVMKEVADGASISFSKGLQFINPIETFVDQYQECRMGLPAFSYLVGYNDPRLGKYYKAADNKNAIPVPFDGKSYLPLPPGLGVSNTNFNTCSWPNIEKTTPIYWLRTSEVYFLMAEAALYGYAMGDSADNLYIKGIETSFAENGLTKEQADKYAQSTLTPASVDLSNVQGVNRAFPAPSNATVKFSGDIEQKLEKIIIQKYIALYPNGQEAWSEFRRTGYPKMQPIISNRSNGIVNSVAGVRRFVYYKPTARSKDEQQAYDKAVMLLGGADSPSTKLWWDKK